MIDTRIVDAPHEQPVEFGLFFIAAAIGLFVTIAISTRRKKRKWKSNYQMSK
jgi:hypothetical protein